MNLVSSLRWVDNRIMSTMTAPLPHVPRTRTLRSRLQPVSARARQTMHLLRRINEGLDADDHASLSELTLRPYPEARFR